MSLFFAEADDLLNQIRGGKGGKRKGNVGLKNATFKTKTFALASAMHNPRKTTRHVLVQLNEADSFNDVLRKLKKAYGVSDATYFRCNVMTGEDVESFDGRPLHLFMTDNRNYLFLNLI